MLCSEGASYGKLVQNANRFVIEQICREAGKRDSEKIGAIQDIFGYKIVSITRCLCGKEQHRDLMPFVIDLVYAKSVASFV